MKKTEETVMSNQAPGLPPLSQKQNESPILDDEQIELEQQAQAQEAIDKLKKLELLKEIESIKPDYEQRQLAIEVCCLFLSHLIRKLKFKTV